LSLRSDNFDSVGELYTKDDLGELVVTIETAPAFFSGLGKLENHGERCLVGKTSVCTQNLIRFDLMTESLSVGRDDRADYPPLEPRRVIPENSIQPGFAR